MAYAVGKAANPGLEVPAEFHERNGRDHADLTDVHAASAVAVRARHPRPQQRLRMPGPSGAAADVAAVTIAVPAVADIPVVGPVEAVADAGLHCSGGIQPPGQDPAAAGFGQAAWESVACARVDGSLSAEYPGGVCRPACHTEQHGPGSGTDRVCLCTPSEESAAGSLTKASGSVTGTAGTPASATTASPALNATSGKNSAERTPS